MLRVTAICTSHSGPESCANTRRISDERKAGDHFDSDGELLENWGTQGRHLGEFKSPAAIEVDESGQVFVRDYRLDRVQRFDDHGKFIEQWGSVGTGKRHFYLPESMTVRKWNDQLLRGRSRTVRFKVTNFGEAPPWRM